MKKSTLGLTIQITLLTSLLLSAGGVALADPEVITSTPAGKTGDAVFLILWYLIAALAFSVILDPLFRWRWFIKKLHGKGLKTPITIAAALILTWTLNLDFIDRLVRLLDPNGSGSPIMSTVAGALLLAGGGGIFHRIIQKISGDSYLKRVSQVLARPVDIAGAESYSMAAQGRITRLSYSKSQQRLTGSGGSWGARDSAPDHPPIKPGLYAVVPRSLVVGTEDDPIVPRKKLYAEPPFLDGNSFGWFLALFRIDPETGRLLEEEAGLHPLGRGKGSLGCIGITDQDTRPLYNFLKSRYFQTFNLEVTN